MGTKNENDHDHDEAARLDRQYTGDSVNARTHELKEELEHETDQLQRKYVDTGKPETDG